MSIFPKSLLLIGAGKMGNALLRAWHLAGVDRNSITVVDTITEGTLRSLNEVMTAPECVLLAVKPQSLDELLPQVAKKFGNNPLYISIAAGKTIGYYEKYFSGAPIVRAMPNTPALIGKGITALCSNEKANIHHRNIASALMQAAGKILWLDDESLMDAVTAISGSGPAYVFLFLESLIEAGKAQGLTEDVSRQLVIQTLLGSTELANHSTDTLAKLRENVTSKGGATEAALAVLAKDNALKSLFTKAVTSAVKRAKELAQ